MVTNIGNTADGVIISDHATPASGTYAWYIPVLNCQKHMQLNWIDKTRQDLIGGRSMGKKGLIKAMMYEFHDISIANFADYDNLMDAIGEWDANSTLLYLTVKNGWGSNLAIFRTSKATATAIQWTGRLYNYMDKPNPNEVMVHVYFVYNSA